MPEVVPLEWVAARFWRFPEEHLFFRIQAGLPSRVWWPSLTVPCEGSSLTVVGMGSYR